MRQILPEILSLVQHNEQLTNNPESYRPEQCLSCGKTGVWRHGHYERKADHERIGADSLNPVKISRFYCPHCGKTCSTLPECIPPQRHYLWLVQQAIFLLHFSGISYRKISEQYQPGRRTISRWCQRLRSQFKIHTAELCSVVADFGRFTEAIPFWQNVLKQWLLSTAMRILNNRGIMIP